MADKPTVLFVDDEPNILSALRRLVRREAYEALTANGGQEALELLESQQVAVIVSDQRMPGMMGADFLARSRELAPDAVRMMLTGYSDIETATRAINEGEIYRFISKPWDDEDLKLILRDALNRFELENTNRRLTAELKQKSEDLEQLNARLEEKVAERTIELREAYDENVALTRSLQSKVRELEGRDRIAQHLLRFSDLSETLNTFAAVVRDALELETTAVYLLQDAGFRAAAAVGPAADDDLESAHRRLRTAGQLGDACEKIRQNPQVAHVTDATGTDPFALVPIVRGEDLLGIVEARASAGPVSPEQLTALSSFALQAAIAVNDAEAGSSMDEWRDDLDRMLDEAGGVDELVA